MALGIWVRATARQHPKQPVLQDSAELVASAAPGPSLPSWRTGTPSPLSACRERASSPHLYHHLNPLKTDTSRCHQRIKGRWERLISASQTWPAN